MVKKDNVQSTSAVRNQIDAWKLEDYLATRIKGFTRPLKVEQFSHGQSNPTYLLTDGNTAQYVLRKKPPGALLSTSAHAVEREYRVLEALEPINDVPVPKVYLLCEDSDVIGTPFYVMEFVKGRVFEDVQLLSLSPEERKQCWYSVVDTLAMLHSVDYKAVGLADFGKPSAFYQRQIRSLLKVSAAQAAVVDENNNKVGEIPRIHDMIQWFKKNEIPDETTIVHGDFKMDNMVFHPVEPRVIGILDWELSTLGHPLSDLANLLMPFCVPSSGKFMGLSDLKELPIPSMEELIRHYCTKVGRPFPMRNFEFAIVFSLFRLAVITQGIAARVARKQASSAEAKAYAGLWRPMSYTILNIIDGKESPGDSKL